MLNTKDPYMLLSIVNMKLRDENISLYEFCKSYDMEEELLVKKLAGVGYIYNQTHNQFIAE